MAKKKTRLIVSILFIMTIIISAFAPISAFAEDNSSYQPRLTAPNSGISYYSREKNVYFQTGYGMPNCVAYAYGRVYEMNGEKPLINHGSAGDWYFINKSNGYYDYGSTPKLGAVACWSNHVAVVEKINKDGSVTLSESHWGGTYFDTVTYSNLGAHFGQRFYGYIYTYNEGVTSELEKALLAKKKTHTQYKQEATTIPDSASQFSIIKLNNEAVEIDKTELFLSTLL